MSQCDFVLQYDFSNLEIVEIDFITHNMTFYITLWIF